MTDEELDGYLVLILFMFKNVRIGDGKLYFK